MPRAIISVYDKTGLISFMEGLHRYDWQLFATSGTQRAYAEVTQVAIPSLADLIAAEGGTQDSDREYVAHRTSGLLILSNTVQLACINLRPPRLEASIEDRKRAISLDVGGIAMITAAVNSGALVVTNPESYQAVLAHISEGATNDASLGGQLQFAANSHVVDHLTAANALLEPYISSPKA